MSSKQFYILFCISVVTMKMQRLPSLISGELGKDGWLLFLGYMLVNIVGICIVFVIIKHVEPKIVLNPSKNKFFNIFRVILLLSTMIYFLVQADLVYEHIQSLFAGTLFDNLSWPIYSLFLLFAVFFLAHRGIDNIALNFELFTWIIIIPFILIAILGVNQCDFTALLPFETINAKLIFSKLKVFNCWFGDFFLVLYLGVKARDIKLSKTLFAYILSMFFMTFLMIEFTGIYQKFAGIEPGLITELSEHSLLDLSIGRVDWFLILLTEVGAILYCAVNLYFANLCLRSVFPSAKPMVLKIFNAIVLYVLDIFVLVDVNAKINFFCRVMSNVNLFVQAFTIASLLLIALKNSFNAKKNNGLALTNVSDSSNQNKAVDLKKRSKTFKRLNDEFQKKFDNEDTKREKAKTTEKDERVKQKIHAERTTPTKRTVQEQGTVRTKQTAKTKPTTRTKRTKSEAST